MSILHDEHWAKWRTSIEQPMDAGLQEHDHLSFLRHFSGSILPRKLSVGTDCSGIEAPVHALELLGIEVDHKFSSDIDPEVIKSIQANYEPDRIYTDIMARNHKTLPHVDLYVAGFPCQSFSMLGKREGFNNPTKGAIFFECWQTIKSCEPKIYILENVKGLVNHDGGKTYKTIMDHLKKIRNYHVFADVYNTADYGLPQNRERIYIIGLHKKHFNSNFTKPEPIPLEITVGDLIDRTVGRDTSYGNITEHKLNVLQDLIKIGKIDDIDQPWCVNLNVSSAQRSAPKKNICPCLLAGSSTYYYTPIRRRFTPREYLRIQGFSDSFKQVVKDGKMYKQVGNSMSTSVLCFIYQMIFYCAKSKPKIRINIKLKSTSNMCHNSRTDAQNDGMQRPIVTLA